MLAADLAAASIRDAGFVDIAEKGVKMSLRTWPKDKELKSLRFCNRHHPKGVWGTWAMYLLTRVMCWWVPEVQVLVAKIKAALDD